MTKCPDGLHFRAFFIYKVKCVKTYKSFHPLTKIFSKFFPFYISYFLSVYQKHKNFVILIMLYFLNLTDIASNFYFRFTFWKYLIVGAIIIW